MCAPRCGCCKTALQFIQRHVDPAGHMPLDVDPTVLAKAYIELFDDVAIPPHLPDQHTLARWIQETQAAKRGCFQNVA